MIVAATVSPLSPREAEVIALAAEGLTDQQIAGKLGVSHATVRTHMEHIRAALGATNRTHAVVTAVALGILTVEPDQAPAEPQQATGHDPDHDSDPKARAVWEDLTAAGPIGASPSQLARRVGRSRSYVYHLLRSWTGAGWAEPLGRSRWRARTYQPPA